MVWIYDYEGCQYALKSYPLNGLNRVQNLPPFEGPGLMEKVAVYVPESKNNVSPSMNFLDLDTARTLFEKAGFEIEKSFYFARSTYPKDLHLDGREGLGIIGVKP